MAVLQRAFSIVHAGLYQYQLYQVDPNNVDKPDKALLVVAIDLISSLVQALGPESKDAVAPLVQSSGESTLPMLLICMSVRAVIIRRPYRPLG